MKLKTSRSIGSIFLVTYLPTILINIINQATNHFDNEKYFDAIVSVNLTSMMVLSALYISVSESLPNTAYVKYVEIWLLASLIYPFLIVIIHTFIQANRREIKTEIFWTKDSNIKDTGSVRNRKKTHCSIGIDLKKMEMGLFVGKYVAPALAVFLVLVYWIIGFMNKYDGDYAQ